MNGLRCARPFEEDFDRDISLVSEAYSHYFSHYELSVPLLAIDTSEINYVDSDEAFESIYQQIIALADDARQSHFSGDTPSLEGLGATR